MKSEANKIKCQIQNKLKIIEEKEVDNKLQQLEQIKDHNTKYFYALRSLQNSKKNKKASIIVKDKNGNCPGTTSEKIKVIDAYFKENLAPDDMEEQYMQAPHAQ